MIRVSQGEESQDLTLALRERVGFGGGSLRGLGHDETCSERWMHVVATFGDLTHSGNDLCIGGLLEDVASRTGREGLAHIARIVLHRKDEYLAFRGLLEELRQDFDPALTRHHHVEEDHVGLECTGPEDGVLRVACLTDDLHIFLSVEEQAEPRANDGVVVDEDDSDHSGTSTTSVVPAPGEVSTVRWPS